MMDCLKCHMMRMESDQMKYVHVVAFSLDVMIFQIKKEKL